MNTDRIREIEKKLVEINKTISGLDPAIRLAAFEMLAPHYFGDDVQDSTKKHIETKKDKGTSGAPPTDIEAFFDSFDQKKPKDNVLLISAWLYSQYGVFAIKTEYIKTLANKMGLTVPTRPDNTMRSTKKKGKSLFRQHGDGWNLTVHGEAHLKETYKVKKGSKTYPLEVAE